MFILPLTNHLNTETRIRNAATIGFEKPVNGVPPWMDAHGLYFIQSKYLLPGETPWDAYVRLAVAAAQRLNKPQLANKFFELMWKGWLGPASPVLANMGTSRGLPISCNSLHVHDSLEGIFNSAQELAHLSSKGAGVGIYVGDIRPRGTKIKNGAMSSGVIPWCKVYDSATVSVSQSGVRRGASAFYLPFSHGDIRAFINMRRPTGDENLRCMNTHHAVVLTDEDMHEVAKGGEARTLFQEIIRTRAETGEPYIMYVDNVNKVNPLGYAANNLEVKTSNICLLGDELVLTSEGVQPIKLLVGKTVEIWDGEQWVLNRKFGYKGHAKQLIQVTYQDGDQIKTTFNHKFPLVNGTFVEAKDLKAGMEVETHTLTRSVKPDGVIADVEVITVPGVDTYCTEVPTTHKFALADGRMTGNCSEITAYTDDKHTFVCCLSSMNLAKWDEWKDTKAVYYATWFLDGVIQEYIDKAKDLPHFENAIRFATKSRMLGLGAMGYHTLLQKNMLPFGSFGADLLNRAIFSHMAYESNQASRDMAKAYGEPEWCKGTGTRHTHTLSIAPTVSNSAICGNISPGIEPWAANNFEKKSAVGTLFMHNKQLETLLKERGANTEEVWDSITAHAGSVQHVSCLTEEEKEVFLTAREINQMDIIKAAAARQQCIDKYRQGQAQSVNLFFHADADETYVTKVHYAAWKLGLKTLYYYRSKSVSSADLPPSTQSALENITQGITEECTACHG